VEGIIQAADPPHMGLVDVRVATVGAGADSTWYQHFKLRS